MVPKRLGAQLVALCNMAQLARFHFRGTLATQVRVLLFVLKNSLPGAQPSANMEPFQPHFVTREATHARHDHMINIP